MSREVLLEKTTMIVSETDSKGNILYANSDFCKISGYSKDELIGQPHNMVRHQDMPRVAFKDLWDTVKSGKTWNGIVKNKTKSGDYYWVNATAYPIVKQDGSKVLVSIRVKPTKQEINNAADLYKKLIMEQ